MRGKVNGDALNGAGVGITPAYAGKSPYQYTPTPPKVGSPPRMRGKGVVPIQQNVVIRDHPRVCGEKVLDPFVLEELLGSPPRMRGKELDGR